LSVDGQHRHAIAITLLGVALSSRKQLKPPNVSILSFDDVHAAATSMSDAASCPISIQGATRTRAEQAHDLQRESV
jgi:hypothetical protein